MNKVWALTKVLLKTNFLSNQGNGKKKKSKSIGLVGIIVLFAFVFGSLGVPIIYGLNTLLEIVPMNDVLLSLILPLAGVTTVIFGVFSVVNIFYMSKDIEYLLPLPLRAKEILIAKFFVALINEYYILFMFILPCLIGVGVGVDAGVLYYIYTLLIFILLPIIPSAIVTFFILILTKFTGVVKNKDLFTYISMALIILFSFAYNYIIQNVISVDVNNIGTTLQSIENGLLPYFKAIFPFYNSAVVTLVNYNGLNGLFSFIVFLGFNVLSLIIIYFFGDKLYLKSITVTSGNKKNKDNISEVVNKNGVKISSSFMWLLKKEWLIVKRSPIFMLNIVIIVFLMPVILIFSFAITVIGGVESLAFNVDTNAINEYLSNPYVYFIVLTVILFFTSMSFAASTSISREGSSAWFMKVIPISYFKQINVKVFFAVIIDIIGVLLIAVIPIIACKIPLYYVFCVFLPVLILVVLLNYLNIYIDLKRPKLKWNEESVAIKQNLNTLISMLICMAVCAVFGIMAVVFYLYNLKINVIVLSLIVSLVSIVLLALVVYLFYKNNDKLLDNVD